MIVYQGKNDGGELFKIPITVFSRSRVTSFGRCASFVEKKIKTAIWHKRLGHPSEEVLSVMVREHVTSDKRRKRNSKIVLGDILRNMKSGQDIVLIMYYK